MSFPQKELRGDFRLLRMRSTEEVAKLFGGETLNMVKRKVAEEDAFFFNALVEQQKQGKASSQFQYQY